MESPHVTTVPATSHDVQQRMHEFATRALANDRGAMRDLAELVLDELLRRKPDHWGYGAIVRGVTLQLSLAAEHGPIPEPRKLQECAEWAARRTWNARRSSVEQQQLEAFRLRRASGALGRACEIDAHGVCQTHDQEPCASVNGTYVCPVAHPEVLRSAPAPRLGSVA